MDTAIKAQLSTHNLLNAVLDCKFEFRCSSAACFCYVINMTACFRSTLENGTILQRSLLLKNVTSEDLKSTFNCVVTNTFGMAKKFIKLRSGDCVARQKRKD